MRLTLVTAPATEPLTLAEVKEHLRVDGSEEDALLQALLTAAREQVEAEINRYLGLREIELTGETLPGTIALPSADITRVLAVTYYNGTESTVLDNTAYTLLKGSNELLLTLPADLASASNGATIRFEAGLAEVPQSLKAAMKLLIGNLYENRESVVIGTASFANELPFGVKALCHPYRHYGF